MKKVLLALITLSASFSFAMLNKELKPGQSVVICKADSRDSYSSSAISGLSELNKMLIQDTISTSVDLDRDNTAAITVKFPFSVSAPTIATTKNMRSLQREYENTYTYCVTITKQ